MDAEIKKDPYVEFYEKAFNDGFKKGREDTIDWLREYIIESLCPLALKYYDEAVERLKERDDALSD